MDERSPPHWYPLLTLPRHKGQGLWLVYKVLDIIRATAADFAAAAAAAAAAANDDDDDDDKQGWLSKVLLGRRERRQDRA